MVKGYRVSFSFSTTFCLTIFCLTLRVQSATIHVPADQPTIQAGIDAASDGDTVLIAPGTYTGDGNRDIDFKGKSIVVKSEVGPEQTIIDCQGTVEEPHRAFILKSGEDSSTTIEGLTITGGVATAVSNPDNDTLRYGGGHLHT